MREHWKIPPVLLPGMILAVVASACQKQQQAQPSAAIHGDPISAALSTNVAVESQPSNKRKHPKPASFQKRMVEYQVSLAEGASPEPISPFNPKPARIFSQAQLDAMSDDSVPTNYQRISFSALAGFPFAVTAPMADGAANPAAASAATRSQIPEAIRSLDNHSVAIRGFLLPLKMDNGLAVEFLLMRNQGLCCFGTVPKINEWIAVRVLGRGVKPVMDQPITVMGTLNVGDLRENGYLVGLYKLDAEKISGP
jgi:hypothetical protein